MGSTLREMGDFLCRHGEQPRTEHVDVVKPYDLDVRQEAAMRALVALRRRGEACKDDSELIQAMNAHLDISAGSYKWAKRDAVTRLQSKTPKMIYVGDNNFLLDDEQSQREEMRQGIDPFSLVEDGVTSIRLAAFIENASPKQKKAIAFMMEWQRMKDAGVPRPKAMKDKLKRLRKSTGLPLIPTLL